MGALTDDNKTQAKHVEASMGQFSDAGSIPAASTRKQKDPGYRVLLFSEHSSNGALDNRV